MRTAVLVTVLITEGTEGRVGVDKTGVSLTALYISLMSRIQIQRIRDI